MTAAPPPASWLFVRDDQSIWVVRPHGYSMIVSGPGSEGRRHDFTGEDDLQAFQIEMAEELTGSGWILWGVGRNRRGGMDRRGASRTATDRRRPEGPDTERRRTPSLSDA
jgi:hypothetical protein